MVMLSCLSYMSGRLQEVREALKGLQDIAWPRTYSVHEVPEPFREPGIVTGYRSDHCSLRQAIVSVFTPNNEAMNVWTHFIPALYFAWLTTSFSTSMDLFGDRFLLPFTCYMVSACGYMLISSFAHTFSCVSLLARYVCFFFDYIGISMYSWGAALLCFNYSFPPHLMGGWASYVFLPVAAMNTVAATFCSCLSRFCEAKGIRTLLRLGAFAVPAVWIGLMLVQWVFTCFLYSEVCKETTLSLHFGHVFFLILGATFYGSHLPECISPGSFDTMGHSHNLFHICVVISTYYEMLAGLENLRYRRSILETLQWSPSPAWVTLVTPALVTLNAVTVMVFTYFMHRKLNSASYSSSGDSSAEMLNGHSKCA